MTDRYTSFIPAVMANNWPSRLRRYKPLDASTVKVGDKVLLCQTGYIIGRTDNPMWTVEKIGRKWVYLGKVYGNDAADHGWKVLRNGIDRDLCWRELATWEET